MHQGKTVLLLGNYRPSVAIARALHPHGYRIIVVGKGGEGVAEFSRYAEAAPSFPESETDGTASWRDPAILSRTGADIILPVEEIYSRQIAEIPDCLSPKFIWATPSANVVLACLDKPAMFERCKNLGIPTEPFVSATPESLLDAVNVLGLPCVIRPQDSTHRIGGEKVVILESVAQLDQPRFRELNGRSSLVVQRKAAGARENIYFAAQQGRVIGLCQAHVARTDRLDGTGLAVEGRTVAPDAKLVSWTQALTHDLNYTGIGCAQFLVDAQGGVAFLEINPRIAGNHAIAEAAGLPLALMSIELATGKAHDGPMLVGRKGVRFAWTYGDLRGLREALRTRRISRQAALIWAMRLVSAALRANIHMTWSLFDPVPTLALVARQLGAGRFINTKVRPGFSLKKMTQR